MSTEVLRLREIWPKRIDFIKSGLRQGQDRNQEKKKPIKVGAAAKTRSFIADRVWVSVGTWIAGHRTTWRELFKNLEVLEKPV